MIATQPTRALPSAPEAPKLYRMIEQPGPGGDLIRGVALDFHEGQVKAWYSMARIVAMIAGSQSGKTSFGPWWLHKEISTLGPGDYLAVTSNYGLFKLKLLPSLLEVFVDVLGIARLWAGDGVLELCVHEQDEATGLWYPRPGEFLADRSDDPMWGRIIMRSAVAKGGLESATAKAAWLDEAGQDEFTLSAWEAIMRRLSIYRGRVLITTTPYNQGWLKQEVYDRWRQRDPDIEVIQFASVVNPAFPEAEYEDRRAKMADWKFRMFYEGRFDKPEGLIYRAFVDELRTQGGHKVKPFAIPPDWPRFVGVDPGANNTALVWLARDPSTNVLYLYRESLEGDKSSREHATDALRLARDGGENVLTWFLGQKSEKQYRLDWQDAGVYDVSEPPVHEVENGIDAVIELLKTWRLFVFETCRMTLDQFGTYRRKLDEMDEPTDKILNKEKYHLLDALRYAAVGISQWRESGGIFV